MNNKNRRTTQKGFSLIELMIVVVVIGVLSAIAIPQYQKYVAKAEVASALATMTGIKTNVEAYAAENGAFPANSLTDELGVPSSIPVGAITFDPDTSAGVGTIVFTFASSGVSTILHDKIFVLSRTGDGAWECDSVATDGVKDELLPKHCKL
ncbi:pilin [Vibrio splendidus]|jgi:type IV pilus assembly protein PilA|uniref:Pilin n=1 Tax=Vibrio splendidus TaxID=29497 RepID=A0AA43JZV6_VIBSP|nr:pilin [Vibrio splendidus]MDH5924300.1 pilin [Vibrio splendidus]PTP87480.1 prepilin-type cleavage/methylation domain-containing protein [Vibrio splendidus]